MANLRVLEVAEIKTVPGVPWSHPFVERLIGTLRRECLDRTLFRTTGDLEAKLVDFLNYYNGLPRACRIAGTPAGTECGRTWFTYRFCVVPVAKTLSRVVPDSHYRMIL